MKRRRLPFVVALALSMAWLNSFGASTDAPPAPTPSVRTSLAHLPPEVRLRKVHLVRPDLIPYPIEFEIYC